MEALDHTGASLGRSEVVQTLVRARLTDDTVAEEERWLELQKSSFETFTGKVQSVARSSLVVYSVFLLTAVVIAILGRSAWRGRLRGLRWRTAIT